MSVLRIGRQTFTVQTVRSSREAGAIRLEAIATISQADSIRLRENLAALEQNKEVFPVTWDAVTRYNGYYRLMNSDIEVDIVGAERKLVLELDDLGTEDDLMFQSKITGSILANDFGFDLLSEVEAIHAPPAHTFYDVAGAVPGFVTRTTSDGDQIRVYRNASFTTDPKYGVLANDYYKGACRVQYASDAYPIVGYRYAGDPADLQISNGLVKVKVNSITTAFRFDVEFWDGSAWRNKAIRTLLASSEGGASFLFAAILDNRPERCAMRVQGWDTSNRLRTVDIVIRRGSRFAEFYYTTESAQTLAVRLDTAAASTATNERVVQTTADAQGHKAMFASTKSFTADTTNGGLSKGSTTKLDWIVGLELSGSAAGNLAADLAKQYMGYIAEEQRFIYR